MEERWRPKRTRQEASAVRDVRHVGRDGSLRTEENREPVFKDDRETSFLVERRRAVCIRENGIARNASAAV